MKNFIPSDFEKMAVNILQTSYEHNQEEAELLLLREIHEYGNTTCLQIAAMSDHKHFVSNLCCQSLLAKIWYGQIFADVPIKNVLFFFTPIDFFTYYIIILNSRFYSHRYYHFYPQ